MTVSRPNEARATGSSKLSYRRRAALAMRWLQRRTHEGEFYFFRHLGDHEGVFFDVGANVGQSALSFRANNKSHSIISFEANPDLESNLAFVALLLPRFEYRMHGLGSAEGEGTLFVPDVGSVHAHAAGSSDMAFLERRHTDLAMRHKSGRITFSERRFRIMRMDDLGVRPDVVKIDVEGSECDVLRGMAGIMAAQPPIVLMEIKFGDGHARQLLEENGYMLFSYDAHSDSLKLPTPDSVNVICLHRDVHTERFEHLCR